MSDEHRSPVPPPIPGGAPAPSAVTARPAKSILGLTAFIIAIVGFVLALIPLIGVVGFILLVAAFVLAIIALVQKGRSKALAVVALVLSIVGPIAGAIVLATAATRIVGEVLESTGSSSEAPAAPAVEEDDAAVPIGSTATAGTLQLVVTGVEAGVPSVGSMIGDTLLGETAQGQFILVHMTATNTGDKAERFSDTGATLIDAQGREFSANSAAAIYVDGNSAFGGEINPGNTLTHVLVFDIPLDAIATTLQYIAPFTLGGTPAQLSLR